MKDNSTKRYFIENKHLLKILDRISDGIIVISPEREIIFVNETGRKLLKYSEGEIVNSRCKTITNTSRCGENCPLTCALAENRDIEEVEMWYTTKDGNQFLSKTQVLLLKDEKGNFVAGVEIFKDLTFAKEIQQKMEEEFDFSHIIGESRVMKEVFEQVQMVAKTDSTCLITGESGTGKELVANAIHYNSMRKEKSYVKVNCAALNEGVLESELFGHIKGAFTGANWDKVGRFEYANGGTLFLDEIGEMPVSLQVKLLRILQEGEFERVGSSKTIKVNVRIIAATNKNLEDEVRKGNFRNDLYYRLNVFRINIPSLRERKEDIPLLVDHFIKKVSKKMPHKNLLGIEAEALSKLMSYDYPGNIRELENIVEHGAIRARGSYIKLSDLPLPLIPFRIDTETKLHQIQIPLQNLEKELITKTLEDSRWKISKAAQKLGVSRVTLWRKMKEYGLAKTE
jgi:PAS domain S-box-containing protein